MATSPHSNLEVAGSSLARSQCPYGSGFTPDSGLLGGGLRGMAFLAVAAPLTPGIFGITALILRRLSLMVAGGLVLASFMTYASEHLAIR
ncbi:putative glucuronosyltransferase [Helianthus anomalus]